MTKGQMSQNFSSFKKVCACPQKNTFFFFPGSVVRIKSVKEQGKKMKKKGELHILKKSR